MNDIEIYIQDPDPKAVEEWLRTRFDALQLTPFPKGNGYGGYGETDGRRVPLKLFLRAAGKYASLWLESADGPWQDDLSCARDAWQALGREVRCATADWREGEEVENDLWWSFSKEGETQVRWHV